MLAHIRSELARGVDKASLTQSLLAVGWKAKDINATMAAVSPASDVGVPAATAQPKNVTPTQGSSVKTLVENAAAAIFILCVFILTLVSVMGVWQVFSGDVIMKSFETLGLLAFVAVVAIVASRFVGDPGTVALPSPAFRGTRNITLGALIVSSVLLAFLGVLSIWDVITDKNILNKSLSSLAIIAFSSYIIVLVCLEREQNEFWKKRGGQMSGGGAILAIIIFVWLMFALFR